MPLTPPKHNFCAPRSTQWSWPAWRKKRHPNGSTYSSTVKAEVFGKIYDRRKSLNVTPHQGTFVKFVFRERRHALTTHALLRRRAPQDLEADRPF